MNIIMENSLKNSMSYDGYRDLVKQLADSNSTTGNNKTENLAGYTKLNDRRMKRLDKTIKISEVDAKSIKEFHHKITWLVLTESWCGDAAHIIPALNKIASLNKNISLRLVVRDDNLDLMDQFLTNGGRAIPKIIMVDDESGDVIATYGPRPTEATSYVNRFKAMHGQLTDSFKEDLQHWYNTNKGQNVIEDIIDILGKLEPNVCQ